MAKRDYKVAKVRDLADRSNVYIMRSPTKGDCVAGFEEGTRLLLDYDDGSPIPRFRKEADELVTRWIFLNQLEVAPKVVAETKKESEMTFKVGDKVRIKAACTAPYYDYRRMMPATITEINEGNMLHIRIRYDDGKATSRVKEGDLEYVDPPTVTITVSRAEAKAFTECFKKDGYMLAGKGVKRSAVLRAFWRALAEALESEEVRAAKVLLTKAGYTVTVE